MAGLSGGGWTTTLYAAIDPSIRYSFPVAGTIPLYLRTGDRSGTKSNIWMSSIASLAIPISTCSARTALAASRFRFSIVATIAASARRNTSRRTGLDYEPAIRVYEKKVQEALPVRPATFVWTSMILLHAT